MKRIFLICGVFLLVAAACTNSLNQKPSEIVNNSKPTEEVNRDVQRKQDIADIQASVELYFNDHHTYPPTLSALSPYGTVPVAQTPADAPCTEKQNTYTYTLLTPNTYRLEFCLGIVGPRTVTQDFTIKATGPDTEIPK